MNDEKKENRTPTLQNYFQFIIALAAGTIISMLGLYFAEAFGFTDIIKNWP